MTELYAMPNATDALGSADQIMTSNKTSVAGTGYRTLDELIRVTLTAGGGIATGDLAVIQQGGIVVRKAIGNMSAQDAAAVGITGGTIDGTVIGGTTPAAATVTTLNTTGEVSVNSDAAGNGILSIDKDETRTGSLRFLNEGVIRSEINLASGEKSQIKAYDSSGVLVDTPLLWGNDATTDGLTISRSTAITDTTDASSPTDANASLHTNGGASIEKTTHTEDLVVASTVTFTNLPTSPGATGTLWNDAGTIKIV